MRNWFSRQTLRGKVQAVILGTTTLVLLMLFVLQVALQYFDLRRSVLQEVRFLVDMIGDRTTAALITGDRALAAATLEKLSVEPKLICARIYDQKNEIFANYGEDLNPRYHQHFKLNKNADTYHQFYFDHACLHQSLMSDGEWLGTLVIQTSLIDLQKSMLRFTTTWGLTIFIAWLISLLLSRKLRSVISEPIEKLAAAMKTVSEKQAYSLRIKNIGGDELNQLVEGFNQMLEQIELRDSELTQHRDRMDHLAHHDSLTGLPNRLLFNDRLKQAIQRAERAKRELALIFLDLDKFKMINDTLGHDIGDIVLVETACRLEECLRKSDTIARLGGDEFVVILEDFECQDSVKQIAEKIIEELSRECQIMQHSLHVTASLGISFYPSHGSDLTTLKRCADIAMYKAKELGRDNFQFYSPGMETRKRDLLILEEDLRDALRQQHLRIYFQPQVSMRTGKVCTAEALLRWQHPTRGLILPGEFFPMAEETGLIIELGEWALEETCRIALAWLEQGIDPIRCAINISPRQFRQPGLFDKLHAVLEKTGMPPHLVELEITEAVLMDDVEDVIEKMTKLRALGIRLAIGDFGSGASSLSYLRYFPINKLKVDMSFVRDIHRDKYDLAITASVASLARIMGVDALAEGVETQAQESALLGLGIEWAQGFFYQRPMDAADFEAYLRQADIELR